MNIPEKSMKKTGTAKVETSYPQDSPPAPGQPTKDPRLHDEGYYNRQSGKQFIDEFVEDAVARGKGKQVSDDTPDNMGAIMMLMIGKKK